MKQEPLWMFQKRERLFPVKRKPTDFRDEIVLGFCLAVAILAMLGYIK